MYGTLYKTCIIISSFFENLYLAEIKLTLHCQAKQILVKRKKYEKHYFSCWKTLHMVAAKAVEVTHEHECTHGFCDYYMRDVSSSASQGAR